jgi:hypothetical protein
MFWLQTDISKFKLCSAGRALLNILTNNQRAEDSGSDSDVETSECVSQSIDWNWYCFHAACSMQLQRRPQWLNELCLDVCTSNAFFEVIRRGLNQYV